MNPERFARLKELVVTARVLPEAARLPYLERSCVMDPELLEEARCLLEFPTRPNLRTAGMEAWLGDALESVSDGANRIPEYIGPYRIVGLLGQGGMGAVYHAEQTDPFHRSVALKLVRRFLTSSQTMARFHAESETLARMDHPDIARIFDAGEDDDGNPYFVMELVRGVPITDFARASGLSRHDCIRLCVSVCRAVHHAHQKGIIHRDLKPSNVLVTADDDVPTPKVIDFGIAKAMGDGREAGAFTRQGQVLGTLEYMSPEQARGDEVGTQTDIYSLAVILFELLTGMLPHDIRGKPPPEAIRIIAENPSRRLKVMLSPAGHCDRDLDTIVQKCLEPDPDSRYSSAAALADDLERYLSSLPILARSNSTAYQLRKMVGRHKAPFALAATLFVFLLVFGVTMSMMFTSQHRAKQQAEIEAAKAERINSLLRGMLGSVQPRIAGRDVTVVEILDQATRDAGRDLADEPEVQAELRQTIAEAYMSLERFDEARHLLEQSVEVMEREVGPHHPKMAALYDDLTSLEFHRGDLRLAEGYARRALEMHRSFDGEVSPGVRTSLNNLAFIRLQRGYPAEAESLYRSSLALGRELLGEENRDVSVTLNNLGHALLARGRFEDAEETFRESLALRLRILEAGHPWIDGTRRNLATVLPALGAYAEAEEICRASLDAGGSKRAEALGLNLLAQILRDTGRLDEAEATARAAIDSIRAAYGGEHILTAECLQELGRIQHARGAFPDAETTYRKVLSVRERLLDPGHFDVGLIILYLGQLAMDRSMPSAADSLLARALSIQEQHPSGVDWRRNQARISRARCLAQEGMMAEAQEVLRRLDVRPMWPSLVDRWKGLQNALILCELWGWKEEARSIRSEIDRVTGILDDSL